MAYNGTPTGRSSGTQQEVAFGALANELERAAFSFGKLVASATAFGAVVGQWRTLQKELTITNSVARGTTKEFERMERAVRKFSYTSVFSSAQSTEALYFLASAGFNVEQSLSAMTGVLQLAQATMNDVGEASDIVASNIRAFGLEAKDASRISNVFVATITKSQATLQKLGFAMRQVGPVAGVAGLSIEQTAAALGQLFNVGLRGEQAGTALRNVIVRLINPIGEAKDVLQQLGIQTVDANGKMLNFRDIMQQLADKNLTQTTKALIAGTEALAGFEALLASIKSGTFDQLQKSITGTQLAALISVEQMETLNGSFVRFNHIITDIGISIGKEVSPELKSMLDSITDLLITFRELPDKTQSFIIRLGAIAVAFALISSVAGGAAAGVAKFGRVLKGLSTGKSLASFAGLAAGGLGAAFLGKDLLSGGDNTVQSVDFMDRGVRRARDIELQYSDMGEKMRRYRAEMDAATAKSKELEIEVKKAKAQYEALEKSIRDTVAPLRDSGLANSEALVMLNDMFQKMSDNFSDAGHLKQGLSDAGLKGFSALPEGFDKFVDAITEAGITDTERTRRFMYAVNRLSQASTDNYGTYMGVAHQLEANRDNIAKVIAEMYSKAKRSGKQVDPQVLVQRLFDVVFPGATSVKADIGDLKTAKANIDVLNGNLDSVSDSFEMFRDKYKALLSLPMASEAEQRAAEKHLGQITHVFLPKFAKTMEAMKSSTAIEAARARAALTGTIEDQLNATEAELTARHEDAVMKLQTTATKLYQDWLGGIKLEEDKTLAEHNAEIFEAVMGVGKDGKPIGYDEAVKVVDSALSYNKQLHDQVMKILDMRYLTLANLNKADADRRNKAKDDADKRRIADAEFARKLGETLMDAQYATREAINAVGVLDFGEQLNIKLEKAQTELDRAMDVYDTSLLKGVQEKKITQQQADALRAAMQKTLSERGKAIMEGILHSQAIDEQALGYELQAKFAEAQKAIDEAIVTAWAQRGGSRDQAASASVDAANQQAIAQYNTSMKSIADQYEYMHRNLEKLGKTEQEIIAIRKEAEAQAKRRLDLDQEFIRSDEFRLQTERENMKQRVAMYEQQHRETGTMFEGMVYAAKKSQTEQTTIFQFGAKAYEDIVNGMGNTFADFVTGTETSFHDMISGLLKEWARFAAQMASRSLFNSVFGSFFPSANGNVFIHGGAVQAFASGGVVSSPTLFPMAGGQTGLMGEAGPEAVMPLTRNSAGKLAVNAEGMGTTLNYSPNFNITLGGSASGSGGRQDAAAQQDMLRNMSRALDAAVKQTVIEELEKQKRPRGLLNPGISM